MGPSAASLGTGGGVVATFWAGRKPSALPTRSAVATGFEELRRWTMPAAIVTMQSTPT
jgi:hypothetical protein